MKVKRFKSLKSLRGNLRRGIVRLQDAWGPLTEALLVAIVGVAFLAIAVIFGVGGPDDWASFIAAFVVAAIAIFFLRRASRHQAILIEVTTSYLLHGGKPLLDHLLGKLISGRWRREELKPGDALFDVLQEISQGQDWEMKRRIAEALPALGEIDAKRTMRIAGILREDWEPTKWESDLRRRAVEALIIPVTPAGIPLLDVVKVEWVKPLLRLREKDQVYTAMAVAEVLHQWEDTQPKIVVELREDLLRFAERAYSLEERQALAALVDFLRVSRGRNGFAVAEKLEAMSNSLNVFVRIAASRNVLLLSGRFPGKALDFMSKFLEPSQPENVRRPIARERSMEFLIQMLASQPHKSKAKDILCRLLSDPDEIIRVTAFDKAEKLKDQDGHLLLEMVGLVLERETSEVLRDRAERVKRDLTGGTE